MIVFGPKGTHFETAFLPVAMQQLLPLFGVGEDLPGDLETKQSRYPAEE